MKKRYVIDWVEDGQRFLCGTEAKSKEAIRREFGYRKISKLQIHELKDYQRVPQGLHYIDADSYGIEAYR